MILRVAAGLLAAFVFFLVSVTVKSTHEARKFCTEKQLNCNIMRTTHAR